MLEAEEARGQEGNRVLLIHNTGNIREVCVHKVCERVVSNLDWPSVRSRRKAAHRTNAHARHSITNELNGGAGEQLFEHHCVQKPECGAEGM